MSLQNRRGAFWEFEILISELGSDDTTPDIVQTIVIPEVVDLVYTGDYNLKLILVEEVTIEASVEGGQPFVSPNDTLSI